MPATQSEKELARIAKALQKIADAQEPRGARQIFRERHEDTARAENRRRADWALRFAALASVAALLTAVGTLVTVLANL